MSEHYQILAGLEECHADLHEELWYGDGTELLEAIKDADLNVLRVVRGKWYLVQPRDDKDDADITLRAEVTDNAPGSLKYEISDSIEQTVSDEWLVVGIDQNRYIATTTWEKLQRQ